MTSLTKWTCAGLMAVGFVTAASSGVFAAEQGLNEPFQAQFRKDLKTLRHLPCITAFLCGGCRELGETFRLLQISRCSIDFTHHRLGCGELPR